MIGPVLGHRDKWLKIATLRGLRDQLRNNFIGFLYGR